MQITRAITASLFASLSLALPLTHPLLNERSSVAAVTEAGDSVAIPRIPKYSLGFKGGAIASATKTSSKRSMLATSVLAKDTLTVDEQDTATTSDSAPHDMPSININQTMSDETRRLMDELAKNSARGAGRVAAPNLVDETTPAISESEVKRSTATSEDNSAEIAGSATTGPSAVQTPYALRPGAGSTSRVTARTPASSESDGMEFGADKLVSTPAPSSKHANGKCFQYLQYLYSSQGTNES